MLHKFKKIMICGMLSLSMISLTGCGAKLKDFVSADVVDAMTDRLTQNKNIVQILNRNGLISASTYNTMIKNIEAQEKLYSNNEDITTVMCKSIDAIWTFEGNWSTVAPNGTITMAGDDGDVDEFGKGNMKDLILSDYIQNDYTDWGNGAGWQSRTSGKTEPVKVVDISKDSSIFDEALNFEIYVLKSDINTSDKSGGIDGAIESVKNSMGNDGKLTTIAGLTEYFEPAKDKDGNAVKLRDLVEVGDLVCTSTENRYSSLNEPGKDLVVKQEGRDILAFKMQEFNQKNVDKFLSILGIDATNGQSTGKWVYYLSGKNKDGDGGVNRVYLMEYPVYYISGMQDSLNDPDMTELVLAESDLYVNILNGKMLVDVKTNNGAEVKAVVTNANDDAYLTMNGASNFNDSSKSAFVLCGSTEITLENEFDDSNKSVDVMTGRIVLRDYLEVTYAPGFDNVDNSDIAAFGRKIRFVNMMPVKVDYESPVQSMSSNNSSYSGSGPSNQIILLNKNEHCAIFVDKNGAELNGGNTPKLYINDFCDFNSLLNGKIKRPTSAKELVGSGKGEEDAEKSAAGLDWESTTDTVNISTRFPGPDLGKTDYINDGNVLSAAYTIDEQHIHQIFYGVTTTHDLFSSALFSTWVNNSDKEASLGWWNKWLSDNKYVYKLDTTNLEAFLHDNFAFELSQNGIVILDLETVAKIQEEFDKDANAQANRTVRTVSRLLGVFLMFYSVVLGLAYVADVTADLGIRFLEKLTFGQWVAVKYDTDVPTHDQESRQYLTFGRMASRLIVLIGVGALLASVDILNLVIILIDTFGGIANKIGEILTGIV